MCALDYPLSAVLCFMLFCASSCPELNAVARPVLLCALRCCVYSVLLSAQHCPVLRAVLCPTPLCARATQMLRRRRAGVSLPLTLKQMSSMDALMAPKPSACPRGA